MALSNTMLLPTLQWIFWIACGLAVYVYAGYPLCLWLLTLGRRAAPPPLLTDDELPSVSLIVAAYNEERVIEAKLRNCRQLEYPEGKLACIFVSDSTDRTNEILLRYQSSGIQVHILPERRGKVAALAAAFPICEGEILVFSDANTLYRPDALKKLVRHFVDPQVGVVTGDVRLLPSEQAFGQGENLYYRYERRLQELESAFFSTVGVDGAMYALRKQHLQPVSTGLIADDFVTAVNVALQGYRIVYDREAIAEEDPTPNDGMEFQRKIRVVAYAMQSFLAGEGVPRWGQMRLWWTYVSHKLLRWLVSFFLLTMFAASAVAAYRSPWWRWMLSLEIAFYLLAVVGWKFPKMDSRAFRVPYYFCMVNLAALRGVLRALRRGQKPVWARTERSATTQA
jgi:poly-beta-1,6-N-acetyl-D-glucosamine synthase